MLTPGDWCGPGHALHAVARPSDFLLSHLALFAKEDEAHADIWAACMEATLQAGFSLLSFPVTTLPVIHCKERCSRI